jgi:hypothetical protein
LSYHDENDAPHALTDVALATDCVISLLDGAQRAVHVLRLKRD